MTPHVPPTGASEPADPATGGVSRSGPWAVGVSDGVPFAVSRRCRHQLADLSRGSVDEDGCLVCPWHQSRYDVRTGRMVTGPRGVFGYHGPTPGYTGMVRFVGGLLPLRRALARWVSGRVVVDDDRRRH